MLRTAKRSLCKSAYGLLLGSLALIACDNESSEGSAVSQAVVSQTSALQSQVTLAPPTWTLLSETGLYRDIVRKRVAPEVELFSPAYRLWSDGAEKRRWIYLPPGTQIDTSDMDDWIFPIGTKLWKLFYDDTQSPPILLETRLTYRWGENPGDVWQGAFVWNAEGTEAYLAPDGAENVNGTNHDVPSQADCGRCHSGNTDKAIGYTAVQLSHRGSHNLTWLAQAGLLSDPPPGRVQYPVPGRNRVETNALGYLHANCGHCHGNQPNARSCSDLTGLALRVFTTDVTADTTAAYATAVDVLLSGRLWTPPPGVTHRIRLGDVGASGVHYRMQTRVPEDQMPPLATEEVDSEGVELIERWIVQLAGQ